MENIDFLNSQQIYYWIYLLFQKILDFFNPTRIIDAYYKYWPILMLCSLALSALLVFGLWRVHQKMKEVNKKDKKIFDTVLPSVVMDDKPVKNERWERILDYMNSDSQAEWRLAILDADVVLDEMMTKSGYHGDSLGEKLKQVERSDFNTINSAWEAHKIRNAIAHDGSDVILTKRTAKKAIDLYRQVFEEFKYI